MLRTRPKRATVEAVVELLAARLLELAEEVADNTGAFEREVSPGKELRKLTLGNFSIATDTDSPAAADLQALTEWSEFEHLRQAAEANSWFLDAQVIKMGKTPGVGTTFYVVLTFVRDLADLEKSKLGPGPNGAFASSALLPGYR